MQLSSFFMTFKAFELFLILLLVLEIPGAQETPAGIIFSTIL